MFATLHYVLVSVQREHEQAVLFLHGKKIQLSRPAVVPGNDRQVGIFFPVWWQGKTGKNYTFTVHIIYNIAPNPTNWEWGSNWGWEQDMRASNREPETGTGIF